MTTQGERGGTRLVGGRYALEALIGRGGMGEVWRARHVALQTRVAIKFLHGASEPSARARRRFLTEAQVTANLRTRHAVQVFDFGVSADGRPFLVMELLEGETLDKRIARRGRLPLATTSLYLQKAARALERAHALGIVHRDFKPENIMLVADEEEGGEVVKVVDFGIAKLVGDLDATLKGALSHLAETRRAPRASSPDSSSAGSQPSSPSDELTSGGVGTPYYMAPEQVQDSAHVGPAADIWAFGVVAYECLTGRRPFDDASIGRVLSRVLAASPPQPASSIAPVPALFDDWFRVACAAKAADRFPDVQTAAAALVFALESATPAERAPAPAGAPAGAATPSPPAEAAPTLSSRQECAAAAVRAAQGEGDGDDASPPGLPDTPEPSAPQPIEILAAMPQSELSPLASTLDPLPPRSASALPSRPRPAAPPRAKRSIRVLSASLGLAALALGAVLVIHDDPRPTAPPMFSPLAIARAASPDAPVAPSITVLVIRPPAAPVEPAVASSTPDESFPGAGGSTARAPAEPSPSEASETWAGKRLAEPAALPAATPARARVRRRPSEASPSAYRLPPLGI